jgi:hypothetical protein
MLIRRNYFVTSVVNLPKSLRENPLRRKRMNYICAVKLRTRGNAGHHIHLKVDVRDI